VGVQYATPGAWEELFDDLAAHPPAIVIDMSARTFFTLERFPRLSTWLFANYRHVTDVLGARIYERVAP
jgi:hypothetical protein